MCTHLHSDVNHWSIVFLSSDMLYFLYYVTVFRSQSTARGSDEETGGYTGPNQDPDQSGAHTDTTTYTSFLNELLSMISLTNKESPARFHKGEKY